MASKIPTNEFELYYESNDKICEPEQFKIIDKKVLESDKTIRKWFRGVLKYFNDTLRPGEASRNFVKVTRKYKVKLKSGEIKYKFIKV